MKTLIITSLTLILIHFSLLGQINYYCYDSDLVYETPRNYKPGSMAGYLTYQELLDELDLMKSKYPHLISSRAPIGHFLTEGTPDTSVTPNIGGNPLEWVRISDNPELDENEPEILYDSLIHGNEWGSLMQLVYYMWYLLENYETNAMIREIINHAELYFVPVVNPDGFLYSQVYYTEFPNNSPPGRKNRKNAFNRFEGVDINRNFNHFINGDPNNPTWGGEGSNTNDPSSYDYAGTGPFSEIESQAIKWFAENHRFSLHLAYHNFSGSTGGTTYYPFFFNTSHPTEAKTFKKMSLELTYFNNYIFQKFPFNIPGSISDFMYGTVGTHEKIFSILMEVPSGTDGLMIASPERVIEISKETLSKNIAAGKLILNYATITDNHPLHTGNSFTPDITFKIERVGLNGSGDFTISYLPVSNNILKAGDKVQVTNLNFLQAYEGSIQLKLDPAIKPGEEIIFDIVVHNGLYDEHKRIIKKFGAAEVVFHNKGENILKDFEVSIANTWEISEDDHISAPTAIRIATTTEETSYLTAKETLDLSSAVSASVSFYTRWDLTGWEFVEFQVSLDNENWEPLCGKLTRKSHFEENFNEPGYDNNLFFWVLEEIDLKDYIGETIYYRFEYDPLFYDPQYTANSEFWLDDIQVNVVPKDLDQSENTMLVVYPNPVEDILYIDTNYLNYTINLFDVLGKQIDENENLSNPQYVDFSSYSQGIYFLKVESSSISKTFKILKN